jgi:hypothetical protein
MGDAGMKGILPDTKYIIYAVESPVDRKIIYVGVSESLDKAKRALYQADNPRLAAEITTIRAARLKPIITVLEVAGLAEVKRKALGWRCALRELGHRLHNRPDKDVPKRAAGRRMVRKMPSTTFTITLPVVLVENSTFKRYVAGGMLGARVAELLVSKVEELERASSTQGVDS